MTHITCTLTAKNRDQLRNPTLGNRVWASFTFYETFLPCVIAGWMLLIDAGASCGHVTRSKRIEIMLEAAGAPKEDPGCREDDGRGCEGFGLVLRGGTHQGDMDHSGPISVSRVIPNSPADRSAAITSKWLR